MSESRDLFTQPAVRWGLYLAKQGFKVEFTQTRLTARVWHNDAPSMTSFILVDHHWGNALICNRVIDILDTERRGDG